MFARNCFLLGLLAASACAVSAQVRANTDFVVRLSPPGINTKTAAENDEIHAITLKPEAFAGYEMIGKIVKTKRSGKLKGGTTLALRFAWLEKDGRQIAINGTLKQVTNSKGAPDVDEEGRAIKTKNNYGKVAGVAAVGALIGALSGGGKGAAIGAGAGAAAAILFVEVKAENGADFELAPNSVLVITVSPVDDRQALPQTTSLPAPNSDGNSFAGVREFRVRHDHGSSGNNPAGWRYCEGVLYVFPDQIKFVPASSRDGQFHPFEARFDQIQEIRKNFMPTMGTDTFHIRMLSGENLNFVAGNSTAEIMNTFPSPPRK